MRLAEEVFDTIATRLADRHEALALFLSERESCDPWCLWEAYAACREHGWTVQPRPAYASAGLMGSRASADLLVSDPGRGDRVLLELAVIHDWTTNRWIAALNHDTDLLSKTLGPGTVPMQIVAAASLDGPVEVDRTRATWLGMTRIWRTPTDHERDFAIGDDGRMLVKGWLCGTG